MLDRDMGGNVAAPRERANMPLYGTRGPR
jgi:hypothetical protein